MRSAFRFFIFICCIAFGVAGQLPPLTVKDLSLMLRSGYSSVAVQQEVAKRRFVDSIDDEKENALRKAGASPELIENLKRGAYGMSPEELAALEKDMAARTQRRSLPATPTRNPEPTATRPPAAKPSGPLLADRIHGTLVTSKNGVLQTFNNQSLEKKKLIALYFSARWCPQCRKFTPRLVEYYNRISAAHPEFELVFVSRDRSSSAMEEYMRDSQMPWPAIAYDSLSQNEDVLAYAGSGIPCLVVLDAQGRVISHSYEGKTYVGPAKVLSDLDRVFAGGEPRVAQDD